ncbi:MAG: hypothetical protein NVS1B13_01470 [Flavisolibacter sp.]
MLVTTPHLGDKFSVIEAKKNTSTLTKPLLKHEEFIPWGNERRLSWEDYLCEPMLNSDAVASTSTSLGIAYQVKDSRLTYHITCDFSKTKSWGLLKTDYILMHEQGHFDITEIFARKLYEALQHYQYNKRSFKKDVNEIYQSIVKEKEAFQQMYDEQSDHSRKRKWQYQWLDKIQQLLQDTAPYANYP